MHEIEMLEDTCEMLNRELERANAKLTKSGGDMSVGDLDYIDKLTHAIKSVKTTLAMLESDNYSHGYDYADGDMTMRSYARGGRGRGGYSRARRRDRMGRYSTEGYSYADNAEMIEDLRELMQDAKDPKTKEEFKHFIQRLESL